MEPNAVASSTAVMNPRQTTGSSHPGGCGRLAALRLLGYHTLAGSLLALWRLRCIESGAVVAALRTVHSHCLMAVTVVLAMMRVLGGLHVLALVQWTNAMPAGCTIQGTKWELIRKTRAPPRAALLVPRCAMLCCPAGGWPRRFWPAHPTPSPRCVPLNWARDACTCCGADVVKVSCMAALLLCTTQQLKRKGAPHPLSVGGCCHFLPPLPASCILHNTTPIQYPPGALPPGRTSTPLALCCGRC